MFKITISAACGGIHLQPQHLKGQGGQISAAWTTYKFRPAKDTLKDLFQNKKQDYYIGGHLSLCKVQSFFF